MTRPGNEGLARLVFLHYSRAKREEEVVVVLVAVRERKSVNETEGCKARHLFDLMETISNAALLFVHRCLPLASPSPNHSRPVAAVKLVSHAFNISLSSPRRFHAPCDIDHQLTLASRSCTTTIHHSCCTTPDPPHRITRKQQLIPAFPALSH
jgi:hypothetical protein